VRDVRGDDTAGDDTDEEVRFRNDSIDVIVVVVVILMVD
jgi:hypothetical protein